MIQATRNRSAGGLPCEVEYYGVSQRGLPEGRQTLAVKPQTKKGPAVMDLRRVVLRPAL